MRRLGERVARRGRLEAAHKRCTSLGGREEPVAVEDEAAPTAASARPLRDVPRSVDVRRRDAQLVVPAPAAVAELRGEQRTDGPLADFARLAGGQQAERLDRQTRRERIGFVRAA